MKKKKLIVIIGIILIIVVAVVFTIVIVKNNNTSSGMNVERNESIDIGPIRDKFNNNIEDLKESINNTQD